ncbi:MAG: NADH-quinone oxidoreductase subunit A [Acidimicrobiia bacterium]
MGQYLPVVAMAVLALLFAAISLVVSKLLAPKRATSAKLAPYECGIVPSREAPDRFPVSFYLVAMLFIMFDIEVIFLYPYAIAHESLGAFGFGAIMFFSVVFFLSFVYEVGRGGLDWGPIARARRLVASDAPTAAGVKVVGLEGRREEAA